MTASSIFRRTALASGLVTAEQLRRAEETLRSAPWGPSASTIEIDDALLADRLVEMGILTPYQAIQLRAGRSKLSLGPYLIVDFIGQGGMGQVFKGIHRMMGREVAVKVLPLSKSTPEAIAHFEHEIRLQAQLDHPNLVRAYDAGADGNVHFLVTEFVPGTDLRRLVRKSGCLSMQQAASIISQAARGLEYAHRRGMLHRDVKPGNILVAPDGTTKVSDLGLAGFVREAESDPRAGKIVGTADYLSPDQIRDPRNLGPPSDIYSLGCTLYYAVTGKVPYPGGTARDKARRHVEDTPWHPHRFNPDLSEDFIEVIADMMEKDPKMRIQSAAEVIARLEPWMGDKQEIPEQSARSPWIAPPPPAVPTDQEELHDTDGGSGGLEGSSRYTGAVSQASQGTDPITSAGHETPRIAPAIPQPEPPSPAPILPPWALLLGIAVPLSMLAGALLMLLAIWLLW